MTALYRKLNSRGDTIVEVLISIAVVSAVLGGAYAVVNRTTQNSQQSKEHSQALKVAETQIEQLRSLSLLPGDDRNQFCIRGGLARNITDSSITASPLEDKSKYTDCKFSDGSVVDRFYVTITKNGKAYKVTVWWDGATGNKDVVELAYIPAYEGTP